MDLIKFDLFDALAATFEGTEGASEPKAMLLNLNRIESVTPYVRYQNDTPTKLKSQLKLIDGGCFYSLLAPNEIYEMIKQQQD